MILRGVLVIASSLAVLGLAITVLGCVAVSAVQLVRSGRVAARVRRTASWALRSLVVAGLAWQVAFGWGDWVHLHWTVESLLLVLFLASGLLHVLAEAGPEGSDAPARRPALGASLRWFAWTGGVALVPLVLITALPFAYEDVRGIGAPIQELVGLAAWGLGGELPGWLAPTTSLPGAREVGYLPRNVTTPFAAGLLLGWYGCGYAVVRVVVAALPAARLRTLVALVGPCALALLVRVADPAWERLAFDAELFVPGSTHGPIWASDPATLRAFGPVLLLGALAALVALGVDRWGAAARGLAPIRERAPGCADHPPRPAGR